MLDSEAKRTKGGETCESIEGGYSIFLDQETIHSFMESGDFSSARELDHFKEVEAQVERWLKEGEGVSLLALSGNENAVPRDFSVLQIAHLMAKHGKSVLIVDIDFLHPGMNGLVEKPDDHGFLDLLLYGSSLKSISRSIGIDGVSIAGPGSFPVSKTVPFALKEFAKIKNFLSKRSDAVIYCSTLYAEDGAVNPLCTEVDGIIIGCRIEEMEEGQLKKILSDLGSNVPPVDLICFCDRKEEARAPARAGRGEEERAEAAPAIKTAVEELEGGAGTDAGELHAEYIEMTEEIVEPPRRRGRINIARLATIVAAILIISFVTWWLVIDRSVRNRRETGTMTELVQKQRDARDGATERGRQPQGPGTAAGVDSAAAAVESPAAVPQGAGGAPAETTAAPPVRSETPPSGEEAVREEEGARRETAAPPGRYAVHVASFRDIARAGIEKERLEKKGFVVSIVAVDLKGVEWFRILVGEYSTREEAVQARTELMDRAGVGYANIIDLGKQQ